MHQPVVCSNNLVHGKPVVSTAGVVVPLVNWAGTGIENISNLTVTVNITAVTPGMKVALASGLAVRELPPPPSEEDVHTHQVTNHLSIHGIF